MRRIFLYIYVCASLLALSSCDEWLDVNKDPNTAVDVDADYLFAYAVTSWAGNRAGGDSYLPIGLSSQIIASGGSYGWGVGADNYSISPYSIGNTWKLYFASGGNNLVQAMDIARESGIPNAEAQAKVVLANYMYECTSIWGDMPILQAWQPKEYPEPVFDGQEVVLNEVLTWLDEALALFDVSDKKKIDFNDPLFGGDIEKWIKYAKSLKLKVLMLMVDKDASKATDIGNLITAGGLLESNSDNVEFDFYTTSNQENPKFKLLKKYNNNKNTWFFANEVTFDIMDAYADSRIERYFDLGTAIGQTEYNGVETAQEADTTTSTISEYLYRADAPELILSYSEVAMYIAEAYARGLGVAQNLGTANGYFQNAVKASCEYYKADADKTTDFLNNLPDLSSLGAAKAKEEIHKQQWVDYMDRPLDAWTNFRRSGPKGSEIPSLDLPQGAPAGGLIRRWDYPNDELTGNGNAPKVLPKHYENLWFDL